MIKYNLLPVFAFLAGFCHADYYNCSGTHTISPATNDNHIWFYPSSWNDSMTAPQYAGMQNCSWTILVPKGTYAYFALKADTNKTATLTMMDSVDYVTTFTTAAMDPFFLLGPLFIVELQASGIGSLGLRVQWRNVSDVYPTTKKVTSNSTPVVLRSGDFDNSTVIESETRVSILAIPPSGTFTDLSPFMRATQVFDGNSINSTFLGNLWQIMASGKNLVSSGKYLTLYSLMPGLVIGDAVILQDYNDVKQFKTYKGIRCILPNICQVSLDASNGPAAAIKYSDPFYVKQVSLPETSRLSVYNDHVTDTHLLMDYTFDSSLTSFPQLFNNRFTTFVLDKGQTTFQLSSDAYDASWNVPFQGRRGFFASPNFGTNSVNQGFKQQISGWQTFNISYTVDRSAITGNASLIVLVFRGDTATQENTFSTTNFPNGLYNAIGDNIVVEYLPEGTNTTGEFVTFLFDRYSSAKGFGFLTAFIFTFLALIMF